MEKGMNAMLFDWIIISLFIIDILRSVERYGMCDANDLLDDNNGCWAEMCWDQKVEAWWFLIITEKVLMH